VDAQITLGLCGDGLLSDPDLGRYSLRALAEVDGEILAPPSAPDLDASSPDDFVCTWLAEDVLGFLERRMCDLYRTRLVAVYQIVPVGRQNTWVFG
jgi:hypothetical protein